jgi:trigger factor
VKSAVENLSPTRVKLSVEVTSDELAPRLDAAYKSIGASVTVPGFRRGKVPARIIDQRFGRGAVVQQALDEALPEYYTQAMQENDLRPLGQPELNLTELPVDAGKDLKFDAEVDIVPSFELPDLGGIEVEVDPLTVDEEDVQTRMDALRARFGTLVGVDRAAADGDFTSIDLRAVVDGEEVDSVTGVSYEIGSKTMIDGLDEALVGHVAGDTIEFQAPLAGGERAGQSADITVVLQAVKERQLPELDDEFAQLASEFDTLEELQEDVRRQAEQAAKLEQGIQARDRLLEKLLEMVDIPVPENLVETEVHEHLEGENRLEDDEHRTEVTESTRKAMRTQFLLDALVARDEVQVSQNELVEYIMMASQQYGMNPNEFAQQLDQGGQVPSMVAEVGRRKALAVVLEQAVVRDTEGTVIDLDEVTGDDDEVTEDADEVTGADGDAVAVQEDEATEVPEDETTSAPEDETTNA